VNVSQLFSYLYARIINNYISTKTEIDPAMPHHYQVDVRDVALAHVLAYENPKASNQRYLLAAEPFSYRDVFFLKLTLTPLSNPNLRVARIHCLRNFVFYVSLLLLTFFPLPLPPSIPLSFPRWWK
jgi:hypothetical protein